MTWDFSTGADEHLAEHNLFDHAGLATPTAGKILGVSGGKYTQIDPDVSVATRVTTNYTVVSGDGVILVNTDGGAVTISLSALSTMNLETVVIKRIGSNAVLIDPSGTEQIETEGSQQSTKSLDSDGAHWSGIASSVDGVWITVGELGTVT